MSWFLRPHKEKDQSSDAGKKKVMPDGLWTKCEECGELIFSKTLKENNQVCPKCNFHFVISAKERISLLLDEGTFKEYDGDLESFDILEFQGAKSYKEKIIEEQKKTGLKDAIISGIGLIDGFEVSICVTDSRFIMGSMGCVVGEKIARAADRSLEKNIPLIIISGSGGGARMYEGIFSLMQMAKTSASVAKLNEQRILYISILTNPTMAGIMASFASLGDVIMAEPKALIGFTGPRVIEQTIKQKLPTGFQRSEFLLEHGFLDCIVHRNQMKQELSRMLHLFDYQKKSVEKI